MESSEQTGIHHRHNGLQCEIIGQKIIPQAGDTHQSAFWKYLMALRPWSFSASLLPVLLGTIISWKENHTVNILSAFLTCISVLTVHGAGNLVNTYYDFIKGIDNKESDDKTLVNQILSSDDIVRFGVLIYIIGCICFLVTLALSPARADHLALLFFVGVSGSFFYTGSIGLKYYALGEVVIFITFGPLSVVYAYIVQCGHFSIAPLIYVIPLVMNTEAILHSNNTRDMNSDKKTNVITLAILLGFNLSYLLYLILVFVPYLIMLTFAARQSAWFLLPISTIKVALTLEKDFRFKRLTLIAQNTAKLNLLFGLLYVISFSLA